MKKEKDYYQVSLKVILKNNKGEVLILKALDTGSYAGYYDVPGGRINIDEFTTDFIEVASREVKEEIGNASFSIKSKPVAVARHLIPARLTKDQKDIHVLYLFFEAEYQSGEIIISDEHVGYQWIDLNKIELSEFFTSGVLQGMQMYLNKK